MRDEIVLKVEVRIGSGDSLMERFKYHLVEPPSFFCPAPAIFPPKHMILRALRTRVFEPFKCGV